MNTKKNPSISVILTLGTFLVTLSYCKSEYKTYPKEWIKFEDQRTGNMVWQITSHDSISEAFYFYVNSVTSDDKYIIFRSKRSGQFEIYRCNLANGKIAQLTEEGIDNACIHPDGKNMVYLSGWKYYKMDVHTMKKEMILDFTDKLPAKPFFRPSLTNDGKYTIVFTRQDNIISLYRVNLEKKEILKVMEQAGGSFSHQLINPVDPNIITYNPLPDTQNNNNLP
ncbi:MAG: oligogalacturonide lyase, partial [Bacteroidota bacterium]|nr:oligogalacturonide lyase [Bacteroidota bacterium]